MAARVIMVASGKGGTGKSTVSVFTAGCLAKRGRRVLLVELDSGLRSVDYIAGIAGKTVYDIGDILEGRCDAAKAIVESPLYKGLYVVSAPYSGGNVRVDALAAFVRSAREVFDDIFLVCRCGAIARAVNLSSILHNLTICPAGRACRFLKILYITRRLCGRGRCDIMKKIRPSIRGRPDQEAVYEDPRTGRARACADDGG